MTALVFTVLAVAVVAGLLLYALTHHRRHGLARVLAWWGEDPGPTPDALTHAIAGTDPAGPLGGVLFVSREMHEQLKRQAAAGDLNHPDRARRQAAEAAWLATHRAHRAAVVAQREAGDA